MVPPLIDSVLRVVKGGNLMGKKSWVFVVVALSLAAFQTTGIDGPHADFSEYSPSGDSPYPGVIVLPVLGGMNSYTEEFAQQLAQEGYVTVAADFFTGPLEPVYDYLQKHKKVGPNRIGFVGFSKGAQYSLEMERFWGFTKKKRPIKGVIAYYIDNSVPTSRPDYKAVLFLHGEQDRTTPWKGIVSFCKNQKAEGKICEYKIYKNTTHAFTHDSSWGTYHSKNETDAYGRAVEFLGRQLKN